MPTISTTLFLALFQIALACTSLSPEQCAAKCVPFDAGTPDQSDFSCGDWWINAKCCNGTESQTVVTSKYFECSCKVQSMTSRGLAVIIVLIIATCASIAGAVVFVLHRKKKKILADEEQRDKAKEEAQVYLPR